jgi:phage-related protein
MSYLLSFPQKQQKSLLKKLNQFQQSVRAVTTRVMKRKRKPTVGGVAHRKYYYFLIG